MSLKEKKLRCFGHKREVGPKGDERETCDVVRHEEFIRFCKKDLCDTFACPFYKPAAYKDAVRIGYDLYPLVPKRKAEE